MTRPDVSAPSAQLRHLGGVLYHHLLPSTDPCEDRGTSWPCDVALALHGVDVHPRCFIDDCTGPATHIRDAYPDDVRLCEAHADLDDGPDW